MGLLSRFLRSTKKPAPDSSRADRAFAIAHLSWRQDATVPIPDWGALHKAAPVGADRETLHAYWSDAAAQWLDRLKTHLGEPYGIADSKHFVLLTALEPRLANLTLEICERARKRILHTLHGVADQRGYGPHVVLAFATQDEYYAYVDHYYSEPGTYSTSSGMFINDGYGHFVFPSEATWTLEPTIAHELTHCLVSHLPLPAWLNEGMAMTMEKHLNPSHDNPRYALYSPREMAEKHRAFWNAETIQEFWSGKAYLRPDEGSSLSYDLGEKIVRMISRDYALFTAFANAATDEDAGASAASDKLGVDLEECAAAVLGAGPWRPDPSRWNEGTERGQF